MKIIYPIVLPVEDWCKNEYQELCKFVKGFVPEKFELNKEYNLLRSIFFNGMWRLDHMKVRCSGEEVDYSGLHESVNFTTFDELINSWDIKNYLIHKSLPDSPNMIYIALNPITKEQFDHIDTSLNMFITLSKFNKTNMDEILYKARINESKTL